MLACAARDPRKGVRQCSTAEGALGRGHRGCERCARALELSTTRNRPSARITTKRHVAATPAKGSAALQPGSSHSTGGASALQQVQSYGRMEEKVFVPAASVECSWELVLGVHEAQRLLCIPRLDHLVRGSEQGPHVVDGWKGPTPGNFLKLIQTAGCPARPSPAACRASDGGTRAPAPLRKSAFRERLARPFRKQCQLELDARHCVGVRRTHAISH